jgi:L-serine dehydratase
MARALLGQEPVKADILLHGSFASTGEGHGTLQAIIAGLLGMSTDDERIPKSFEIAAERGLEFSFDKTALRDVHPNSALLTLVGAGGRRLEVGASSPGGGRIRVFSVDGLETSFSGELPTLVVHNTDQPGCVSQVTAVLARRGLNVATLQLNRGGRGGSAVMVIECDQPVFDRAVEEISALPGILRVTRYTPEQEAQI